MSDAFTVAPVFDFSTFGLLPPAEFREDMLPQFQAHLQQVPTPDLVSVAHRVLKIAIPNLNSLVDATKNEVLRRIGESTLTTGAKRHACLEAVDGVVAVNEARLSVSVNQPVAVALLKSKGLTQAITSSVTIKDQEAVIEILREQGRLDLIETTESVSHEALEGLVNANLLTAEEIHPALVVKKVDVLQFRAEKPANRGK